MMLYEHLVEMVEQQVGWQNCLRGTLKLFFFYQNCSDFFFGPRGQQNNLKESLIKQRVVFPLGI